MPPDVKKLSFPRKNLAFDGRQDLLGIHSKAGFLPQRLPQTCERRTFECMVRLTDGEAFVLSLYFAHEIQHICLHWARKFAHSGAPCSRPSRLITSPAQATPFRDVPEGPRFVSAPMERAVFGLPGELSGFWRDRQSIRRKIRLLYCRACGTVSTYGNCRCQDTDAARSLKMSFIPIAPGKATSQVDA
jgi:hypothetical protein